MEADLSRDALPETMRDLDQQIKVLKAQIQRDVWMIGQRLDRILANQLFAEMGYPRFKDYVERELDFQERTAYKYIAVARTFTLDEARQLPSEKLTLLAKLEDRSQRDTLFERTQREGLSVRRLQDEVRQLLGSAEPRKEVPESDDAVRVHTKRAKNRVQLTIDLPASLTTEAVESLSHEAERWISETLAKLDSENG